MKSLFQEVICFFFWISFGKCFLFVWMSGEIPNSGLGVGEYGTQGVSSPNNFPGTRWIRHSWTHQNDDSFWIFGGRGSLGTVSTGKLNDLWKWDSKISEWTWISGPQQIESGGNYGEKGTASASNLPPSRQDATTWVDVVDGSFWLFGGDLRNDVWKWDGQYWTWISGNNSRNIPGVYGTQGVSSESNYPGSRINSVSWQTSDQTVWIFGGTGFTINVENVGWLNDLWRWDGQYWTWMAGTATLNFLGTYGTKGVSHPNNKPSSREESVGWLGADDSLWLFGGIRSGKQFFSPINLF